SDFSTCAKKIYGTLGSGSGDFNWDPSIAIRESDHTAWVVDWKNNRITVWRTSTNPPTQIAAFGSLGSGNNQFNQPHGVGVDPSGDIWVADTNNFRVVKLTTSGTTVTSFTAYTANGALKLPEGVDADGTHVYV